MVLWTVDEIEQSFLANIEWGERALQSAEDDYQRLEVRYVARAAQVITAVTGRLVQRAEWAALGG